MLMLNIKFVNPGPTSYKVFNKKTMDILAQLINAFLSIIHTEAKNFYLNRFNPKIWGIID